MLGEYLNSNYGTRGALMLKDGRLVQVSTVDGDSPYIVSGNNPQYPYAHARPNGNISNTEFFAISAGVVIAGGLVVGLLSGFVTAKVLNA